jgi:hypothetical protein
LRSERISNLEAKVLVEDANRIHMHYHGTNCAQTNDHDEHAHEHAKRRSKKLKDIQGTIMDTGTRKRRKNTSTTLTVPLAAVTIMGTKRKSMDMQRSTIVLRS